MDYMADSGRELCSKYWDNKHRNLLHLQLSLNERKWGSSATNDYYHSWLMCVDLLKTLLDAAYVSFGGGVSVEKCHMYGVGMKMCRSFRKINGLLFFIFFIYFFEPPDWHSVIKKIRRGLRLNLGEHLLLTTKQSCFHSDCSRQTSCQTNLTQLDQILRLWKTSVNQ